MDEITNAITSFVRKIKETSERNLKTPDKHALTRPKQWKVNEIDKIIWIDASDHETIIHTSNRISQVLDKSGHGAHLTQPIVGRRPRTNETTINNLNTINLKFNEFMECKANFHTPPSGNFVVLCVGEYTGPNTLYGGSFWGIRSTTTESKVCLIPYHKTQFNSLLAWDAKALPGNLYGLFPKGYPYNAATLFSSIIDSGIFKISINGEVKGTSEPVETWSRNAMNELYIGRNTLSTTNNTMPCKIGELIIIEHPTKAKVESIEGYLAWKWGLNLSQHHRYKNVKPE